MEQARAQTARHETCSALPNPVAPVQLPRTVTYSLFCELMSPAKQGSHLLAWCVWPTWLVADIRQRRVRGFDSHNAPNNKQTGPPVSFHCHRAVASFALPSCEENPFCMAFGALTFGGMHNRSRFTRTICGLLVLLSSLRYHHKCHGNVASMNTTLRRVVVACAVVCTLDRQLPSQISRASCFFDSRAVTQVG